MLPKGLKEQQSIIVQKVKPQDFQLLPTLKQNQRTRKEK